MTRPAHHRWPTAKDRVRRNGTSPQRTTQQTGADDPDTGSVAAYLVIIVVALFALAGLVLDGGAALAAHGQAADVAQQAARAGADALDEQSLRAATPAGLAADPAAARAAATRCCGRPASPATSSSPAAP